MKYFEEIFLLLLIVFLLSIPPFFAFMFFLGFSWKLVLGSVLVSVIDIATVFAVFEFKTLLEMMNPIPHWQKIFWYQVKMDETASGLKAEQWCEKNCDDKWVRIRYKNIFRFKRREDAIHFKMVWL